MPLSHSEVETVLSMIITFFTIVGFVVIMISLAFPWNWIVLSVVGCLVLYLVLYEFTRNPRKSWHIEHQWSATISGLVVYAILLAILSQSGVLSADLSLMMIPSDIMRILILALFSVLAQTVGYALSYFVHERL